MSKFNPVLDLDSLSPVTTKGDVMVRNASMIQKVGIGADNTVFTADSTQASGAKWAAASANVTVKTLTGATTLPASPQTVFVSGTTFAITLPTPTSNSGLFYRIVKTDDTPTPISIGGSGFIGVTLFTKFEEYTIVCDGITYWPGQHFATTGWTSISGISLSATTTAPTIGQSQLVNKLWWRRDGGVAELRYEFDQTSSTSSAAGSGDYKFSFPAIIVADTTVLTAFSTVAGNVETNVVGSGNIGNAGTGNVATSAIVYDANFFRLKDNSGGGFVGSAHFAVSANVSYNVWMRVPVVGWQP